MKVVVAVVVESSQFAVAVRILGTSLYRIARDQFRDLAGYLGDLPEFSVCYGLNFPGRQRWSASVLFNL